MGPRVAPRPGDLGSAALLADAHKAIAAIEGTPSAWFLGTEAARFRDHAVVVVVVVVGWWHVLETS